MKILSVNAGSSSLKFSLFDLPEENELVSGNFEKIGIGNSFYTIKIKNEKIIREVEMRDHVDAVKLLIEELIENKIIKSMDDIDGIGHRMVHGGSKYSASQLVNDELLEVVESLNELAPLHNPANIKCIRAFQEVLPNVPMTVVFDTAFHQTMEKEEYTYGVPYEWYEKYGVRKYGFHGTSHRYIDKRISEIMGRDDLKIISCHIGNGSSIAAIDSHKVVDTTMGFTPLPGLLMGTRCGDIDPGIIEFIMKKENKTIDEVMNILNKKSGFLGVSGVSSDSRDIESGVSEGNERCLLTQSISTNRLADYQAMYNNKLGGADVIVYTAGIGQNSPDTRRLVAGKTKSLGIELDLEFNDKVIVYGEDAKISTDNSKIPVWVIPTNEELMIALDTYELIR